MFAGWTRGCRRGIVAPMTFMVERIDLVDAAGVLEWQRAVPQSCGEASGLDAEDVLTAVVARDGGIQLGVGAIFIDGQAVMLARKEEIIYALRAFFRDRDAM